MGRSGAKHTHVSYPAFQRDLYLGSAVVSVLFTKLVPPTPTIRHAHTERGPAPGNGRASILPRRRAGQVKPDRAAPEVTFV